MTSRTTSRRGNHDGTAPRQRADGRWTVKVRWVGPDGKPQRTSVYGKTSAEVTRKARELRRRLEDGKPGTDARMILADYVERWVGGPLAASVAGKNRKASTARWYATLARKHIAGSSLGGLPLRKVTQDRVEAWIVELRGRGLADSSIRSCYTTLRQILERGRQDGLVAANAAARVGRPQVDHHEVRCLSADEVRALLAAADGSRFLPLFRLLALTGLRRGEALGLHWTDVDFDGAELHVRRTLARVDGELATTAPKSERSRRRVKVDPAVLEVLREVKARTARERLRAGTKWSRSPYVFTTEFGGPTEPRNAARALTVAAERAGLHGEVSLHSLRHSAASLMLAAGVPLVEVSRHLGHASTAVTADLYAHVLPDHAGRAAQALAQALAAS